MQCRDLRRGIEFHSAARPLCAPVHKRLDTELTEDLCGLCVEFLELLRTRGDSIWLRHALACGWLRCGFGFLQLEYLSDEARKIIREHSPAVAARPLGNLNFDVVPIHRPADARHLEPFAAGSLNNLHVLGRNRIVHVAPSVAQPLLAVLWQETKVETRRGECRAASLPEAV